MAQVIGSCAPLVEDICTIAKVDCYLEVQLHSAFADQGLLMVESHTKPSPLHSAGYGFEVHHDLVGKPKKRMGGAVCWLCLDRTVVSYVTSSVGDQLLDFVSFFEK